MSPLPARASLSTSLSAKGAVTEDLKAESVRRLRLPPDITDKLRYITMPQGPVAIFTTTGLALGHPSPTTVHPSYPNAYGPGAWPFDHPATSQRVTWEDIHERHGRMWPARARAAQVPGFSYPVVEYYDEDEEESVETDPHLTMDDTYCNRTH